MSDLSFGPPPTFPYLCTAAYGEDEYGIWQTVVLHGVAQTFRWCPPGTFQMGSPEKEHLRGSDETQREITLTSGFWLADTACTQALWTALVGENPSRFKGDFLPVEEISYHSVLDFLGRWRELCPVFPVRLPSEAEWEYACRAGTKSPFWFGETIDTEQVNFDGNHRYRDDEPNQGYRRQMVPVKDLPCNDWGLYQMHGNVYEWCSDWFALYDLNDRVNPAGPTEGGLLVVRGGSYFDGAGRCRSAGRGAVRPGDADFILGFRLAACP